MIDENLLPTIRDLAAEGGPTNVYFISAGNYHGRGAVKIGVAKDPEARLRDLQVAHFQPLELIAAFPADTRLERVLHVAFRESHIRGEWFRSSDAMRSLVDELLVSTLDNFHLTRWAA